MSSCETIQQRIQEKRNNLPLPIGGERCIMFWYDSKKDFVDCIDGLHITAGYDKREVKIHKVESFFETKYLLELKDTQSHYILYIPKSHPDKNHENWLLDIEFYASEFKADNLAMAMDECGIESMEWYGKLEDHIHFFGSQERKQLLHDLFLASKQQNNIESLYTCMLAVCVGSKRDTFDDIVIILFKQGFEETNKAWTLIKKSKLEEKFWQQVKEYYDYKNTEPSLTNLWYSMYFGAIAYQQSESSLLRHYGEYIKNIDTTQAFHTLDYWMKRSDFNDIYSKIIDIVENSKDIPSRINELSIDELKERRNITVSPLYEKLALRYCKQNLLSSANQAKINDCIGYRKIHSIRYKMFEYDYGIVENILGLMSLLENIQIEQKSVHDMRNYYKKIARK